MSTNFFSYAGNFRDMDTTGVDARTGQFIVNIPIENIIGNNLLGPEFLLKLSYNPLDRRNWGFGAGFSLGLSQFNRQTSLLELSNGETWQLEPGTTNVRHHPGKDFRFAYTNGHDDKDGYTVFWQDGRTERLQETAWNGEIFCNTAIISPVGHSLKLAWDGIGQLVQINDGAKVFCTINYNSTPVMRMWPGLDEEYRISFEFDDSDTRLNRILYNLSPDKPSDSTEFWSFEYGSIEDEYGPRLTGVIHPAGMSERVEYSSGKKDLAFPEGSNMRSLPVVMHYTRDPGSGQPKIEIHYEYTEQNFLGGSGRQFGDWSADKDYIYKTLTNYTYGSTEILIEGGITVITVREYNNYHLLVSETITIGNDNYRRDFIYYTETLKFIDDQLPQFRFPKEKKEAWGNAEGITHSQSTQTRFDEFGNLLHEVTPVIEGERQGTTTVTSWYAAEGKKDKEGKVICPREPNGFVRFMKEQIITPMETDFDAPVMRMHYSYTTLGDSDHVVPAECSFWSDGILMGKQEFTYHGERDNEHFGRLKKITDTKYDYGENAAFFISRMEVSTYVLDSRLYQKATKTGHDDIVSSTHYSQSVYSGRVFHRTDEQGVVTAYDYDRLGRIVRRTDARGTDYYNELAWSYAFNRDNATAGSVVIKTDMANNRVRSRFDGSGQMLFEERADGDAPERWYTVFRKLDPSPPSATDAVFISSSEAAGDPEPDEGTRIVSTSDKRIGRPVTIRRINSLDEEYSRREYRWDGLGRLREETDELGRVTTYTYDAYGRMLTRTLPDNTIIGWNYAPHLTGAQIASIHVNGFAGDGSRKTEYLGYQFFDSLGRLTQRISGGRNMRYVYRDASPVPIRIIPPSDRSINYTSISSLGHVIGRVNADRISQMFDYDKPTGYPLQISEDLFGQTNQWDTRGRLKTETFFYKESEALAHYGWTPNGSLDTYRDVTGAEFKLERNSDGQVIRLVHSDLTADFAYDGKGRLTTRTVKDISDVAAFTTELGYDDFDRETSRILTDRSGAAPIEMTVTQTWTQNDKLASRITKLSGTIIYRENYVYDQRDRLVSYHATGSNLPEDAYGHEIKEQSYKYDFLNNLVEVKTILKDDSEDIATFSHENGKDPTQLTSVRHTHPNYPQRIDLAYDAEGRLTRDEKGRTLSYDSLGRLSSTSNSTYQYDGFNRLVRQSLLNGRELHDLYYCNDKLVNEVIKRTGSDAQRRFIRFGGNCLGVHDDTGLELTGSDQNGSLIWSRRSNNASMSTVYNWVPYGSGEGDASLPGFNGERIDPVSKVYHLGNGYRSYNPKLMRFTSPDDFSPFGDGGINPYAYCNGDPVNYTDPTGHMSWQAILGIALGSIGLVATVVTAGLAVVAAGGVMTALGAASGTSLVVGGLGITADVTAIAGGALEDTDPELSSTLGWVSFGLGMTGLAAGIGVNILAIQRHRVNPSLHQARLLSESGGSRLTKLGSNMRNVDLLDDGIYTFVDTYKGRERLNIVANGEMVNRSSALASGAKQLDANEVAELLGKRYNLRAYDNLRTISCYSGNGGESSFAATLSQATGKPVKGYIDQVDTTFDKYVLGKIFREYETYGNTKQLQDIAADLNFRIRKTNSAHTYGEAVHTWNYQPVKFLPS